MKIVGKCKCGCVLAVMSEAEERMLTQFAEEIVWKQPVALQVEQPVQVAPLPAKRKARAVAGRTPGKMKECVVCKKPFRPKTSAVTCSPECSKKRMQAIKNQWASKKSDTPPARVVPATSTKPSPIDRMALIRKAAERVNDRHGGPAELEDTEKGA